MIVDETMDEELESLKGFENLEIPDGYTDRQWSLFVGGRTRQAHLAEAMLIAPQKQALIMAYQILRKLDEEESYNLNEVEDFLVYFSHAFCNTITNFRDKHDGETTEKENIQ